MCPLQAAKAKTRVKIRARVKNSFFILYSLKLLIVSQIVVVVTEEGNASDLSKAYAVIFSPKPYGFDSLTANLFFVLALFIDLGQRALLVKAVYFAAANGAEDAVAKPLIIPFKR